MAGNIVEVKSLERMQCWTEARKRHRAPASVDWEILLSNAMSVCYLDQSYVLEVGV